MFLFSEICFFFFWIACLMPDVNDSAIHEMTTINEITTKIDHVPFRCNWFIVLRKWAHRCMLFQKRCFENISKFSAILATVVKSISRKGSFVKLVNVLLKRTLPQLFFDIATLISTKLWKCPVCRNSFSIYCSGEIFPFALTFPNKGAVVQHSYII